MGFKEFQKNLPVFSISVVTKITQLSARQIRYYEEKKLFTPKRTEGNTRLFSLNDIDKLLTIKDLLTKGFNLKAIDEILNEKEVSSQTNKIRQIIHNDIFAGPNGLSREERSIGRGDLSRFYNNKKNKF
ncbi:putative HTH-type transcriptional regulator GlnR [Gemella bergeri ATCC 700627]|uniref:Putative HTH-type transcriptional regulator GlnR n=1 Tax=Gemella bergeri ATCC 700627 TaxID=1321820 RepID=U2SD32_9BACL|nr:MULTISPECIES: MerR family transcriptional regulator [Gemella]AME09742.1 MerR family transcriptional regulator [Gemella sp. oral taxon 928]AXI27343.1 MerR family transcriptional regulator [Gemella sp. ND 6198]ERK60632.1 putative HTH-type transcriptional regulator GlnR [Gemella bergeri ATCC 700627]